MPASAVATGAATGVMPDQILGGPLWWYFVAIYVLALAAALYVSVDSNRPARRDALAALPEPAWLYSVCQPVFLAFAIVVWLPVLPRVVSVVPVALIPFALVGQVAYLLRAVFPKPAGPSAVGTETESAPDED